MSLKAERTEFGNVDEAFDTIQEIYKKTSDTTLDIGDVVNIEKKIANTGSISKNDQTTLEAILKHSQ